MWAYLGTLLVITAATATVVCRTDGWHGNVAVVLGLCVIASAAERGRVTLTPAIHESISLLPTLFAAVLFGPMAAMVVAFASMLPELRPAVDMPSPRLRWAIYSCSRTVSAALVGCAATVAANAFETDLASMLAATTSGALVGQGLDLSFAALTLSLRRRATVRELFTTVGPLSLAAVPLYGPLVAVLAFAYREFSPLTFVLFCAPALAAQRLFSLYQAERQLTADLVGANHVLERVNLSFATALVATLDARDRYTAGHSAAVAVYARDIAERMGLPEEEQNRAHLAGLVHDIGKIGLPAGLLEKPGALTLEERRHMEQHSVIGERILQNVETYAEVAEIVRNHHERVDGQGYPDGHERDGIPLLARIIAVADAYNAMTSDRPYRDAMPSRVARLRLAQAVDSQFDTAVVAAFEAILASAPEEYRLGRDPRFRLDLQPEESVASSAVVAPLLVKAS
jgi:putative nucleotidyltransferase with HDIG domain